MGLRDRFMGFLQKSFYDIDPTRPLAQPRRGLFGFANSLVQKKQQKPFVLNAQTLDRLAKTDPIVWAIERTIKSRVNNTKWAIVPDTERMEKELDRWEEYAVESLNPYGLQDEPFTSQMIDPDLFNELGNKLDAVRKDGNMNDTEKAKAMRWIFKAIKRRLTADAQIHCEEVTKIFEKPNNSAETSLRALQELVMHDLLIFDAGVIIKNYSKTGKLAELYTVPGYQIKIYRNEDRTTPQPPEPAYVWEDQGIMRAEFTNEELLYIMQNPTQEGYGVSPLEVAAYIITASLQAEQFNIDYFKNSNVPPGVFDLGKSITEDQRATFQALWDNEVQGRAGGLHRMLFMSGSEDAKFIPLNTLSNRDMQMMEYMKWTVSIKCACYGLSPQDIGFTDDYKGLGGGGVADVQKNITQSRGIDSLLQLLEQYYNAEIVKSEFGYLDVKFEWQQNDKQETADESKIDIQDIQEGTLSRNERRVKKGLKPIPGGDVITIKTSSGLIPVESLEEQEEKSLEEETGQDKTEGQQPGDVTTGSDGTISPAGADKPGDAPEGESDKGDGGDGGSSDKPGGFGKRKVERPVLKLSVNKKLKTVGKQLDATVQKLRDNGIDAELRIGFGKE